MTSETERIVFLNDLARKAMGVASRVVQTPGVNALPPAERSRIRELVELYDSFAPDNDPYGEHDSGSFNFNDNRIFWKIDYYDNNFEFGSDHPDNASETARVLTIMLAEEY